MARLSGLLLLVVVVALSPQQQASGLMDPDILRRVSEAVRLRGVVLLSGGGGGDGSGVGAEISLSSRRLLRSSSSLGGGTTVKILPVDVAAELDLRLEEREESLVLDTSGVPVDLLGRILRTNLDSLGVRAPAVIVFNSERDFDNSGTAPILPDFAINQVSNCSLFSSGELFFPATEGLGQLFGNCSSPLFPTFLWQHPNCI